MLDNPHQIWDTAFRSHISPMCRHLLYAIFFSSQFGVEIDKLRSIFLPLHSKFCAKYILPFGPKDFEEALKIFEGGFVSIHGNSVDFINPSVRDYLTWYLDNAHILCDIASCSPDAHFVYNIWAHLQVKSFSEHDQKLVCSEFVGVAKKFLDLKKTGDMSISRKISLVLELWDCADLPEFEDVIFQLAGKPSDAFMGASNQGELIEIIENFANDRFSKYLLKGPMMEMLEQALIDSLDIGDFFDELEPILDRIVEGREFLGDNVYNAAARAAAREIVEAGQNSDTHFSSSTLNEQIEFIKKIGPVFGVKLFEMNGAIEAIQDRIIEIEESTKKVSPPKFSNKRIKEGESFDDAQLSSLFSLLTTREI